MATWAWILIAAAVVCVIVLGAAWATMRTRRTHALQDRFGGEYDRTVEREGGRRPAERELREREKRHEELELKPLPAEARSRYLQRWHATQERFVDDPKGAVAEADQLVEQVMEDRGYPVEHFDQQAADISVDHPDLVEKYRTAHGIAMAGERGTADTEDLRHSVRHYRALFVELLGAGAGDDPESVDDVSSRDGGRSGASEREHVSR